jgi:hypothetical protein
LVECRLTRHAGSGDVLRNGARLRPRNAPFFGKAFRCDYELPIWRCNASPALGPCPSSGSAVPAAVDCATAPALALASPHPGLPGPTGLCAMTLGIGSGLRSPQPRARSHSALPTLEAPIDHRALEALPHGLPPPCHHAEAPWCALAGETGHVPSSRLCTTVPLACHMAHEQRPKPTPHWKRHTNRPPRS